MKFELYAHRFREEALRAGFDEAYIKRCLTYAERLNASHLPVIYDPVHFSGLVGFNTSYLFGASFGQSNYYRSFTIPKKNGDTRRLQEPLPNLKEIQRWILDNILAKCKPSRFAKGFVSGRSIIDNARFHKNQPMVLSLDVEDFFGSIGYSRVYGLFQRIGYSPALCRLFSKLCTLNGALPQGSPTSPALSNLICVPFDNR